MTGIAGCCARAATGHAAAPQSRELAQGSREGSQAQLHLPAFRIMLWSFNGCQLAIRRNERRRFDRRAERALG
jgi:hypothetical protein